MPYRRLPNTDNARIKALRTAIEMNQKSFDRIISSDHIVLEAILRKFANAQIEYKSNLNRQVHENQKFQKLIKNARIYISHFIQVLNLAVIRNEIKKEAKRFYKLAPDNFSVPDLTSNEALIIWGENIINGEQERVSTGNGAAIYNPNIARVNVAYSQFRNACNAQKIHQASTARQLELLAEQRSDIDKLLTVIWNEVEAYFSDLPNEQRLEKCKQYGVIYYLRKGEKEIEKDDN